MNNVKYLVLTIWLSSISCLTQASDEVIDESIKSDAVVADIPEQSIEDDSQSLAETLGTGVTSWCQIYSNGKGIGIAVQNTSNKNRRCTISCSYKNKKGYSGAYRATGTVGAKTKKHVWSHKIVSGERYNRNGRGFQSCK